MHLKRHKATKLWSIPRKGTKFIVVPSHNKKNGIPLLIVMRDILKHVKTRKELNKIINEKKIKINEEFVKNDNVSLLLFDVISITSIKKHYIVSLSEHGKINVVEISENESKSKISKIVNKKIVKKNKVQLNMSDGRNVLSKEKISIGDSVVIDMASNKIIKVQPMKEGSEVMIIRGKHVGKIGIVLKIEDKGILINFKNRELKVKFDQAIVIK